MEAGGLLPRQPQQPGPPGSSQLQPTANSNNNNSNSNNNNSLSQQQQQQLHQNHQLQQQLQQQQQQQQQQLQQMGQAPGMGEGVSAKRQAVVDRLRRRMEGYRRRQTDLGPKFDQTFHGFCELNTQETQLLKQRFLDSNKTKRPKKIDKKQNDAGVSATLSNNIHVQQKFLKRSSEELDSSSGGNNEGAFGEPAVKLQCTQTSTASVSHQTHVQQPTNPAANPGSGNNTSGPTSGTQPPPPNNPQGGANTNSGNSSSSTVNAGTESLTKFSVEIVQQLEFTTSAANSQAQQISTNVTVKALTNASVKSDLINSSSSPKSELVPPTSAPSNTTATAGTNPGTVPGNDGSTSVTTPADIINSLVECKEEPDNEFDDLDECVADLCFPGFGGGFMNDDAGADDAFKDLISQIADFRPQMDFIKDLDFEEKALDGPNNGMNVKLEDNKEQLSHGIMHATAQQQQQQQQQPQPQQQQQQQQPQPQPQQQQPPQQQQQNQGSIAPQYSPGANRLAYPGLEFKSEMNHAAQTLKQMAEQHQHKSQQMSIGGFNTSAAVAAAAAAAAAARVPNARSPYAEFGQFGGGTPDYLNSPAGANCAGVMGPNVPYHKNNGANAVPVAFQAQQPDAGMFGQQGQFDLGKRPGGGQNNAAPNKSAANMLNTGGPTVPAGSGYKQQYSPYGSPGSMPNHGSPGYPLPSRITQGPGQGSNSQGGFNNSTPPRPSSGSGASTIQINQAQQLHINSNHPIQVSAGQHMQLTGELKSTNVSVAAQQGMYFNQQQQQSQAQQQQGAPNNQNDTYTVSQSQTINFTQQSLRQRQPTGGVGNAGPTPQQTRTHPGQQQPPQPQQQQPVPGAQLSEQHAKIIQQQNFLRVQQAQQQQLQQLQQHQQHLSSTLIRPPPPEYKAAQAQLMHAGIGIGQQPRLTNAGTMRRVTQQPIPPSGPMMRPQMVQQTAMHAAANPMYIGNTGINVGTNPGTGAVPGGMSAIGGMHQMQQKLGYPRTNNQRPPNVNIGPVDNLGNGIPSRGNNSNWQQIFIHQQQQQQHQQQQQQHHQGGFGVGGGTGIHINATQMQHQQLLHSQNSGMIGGSGINNASLQQQIVLPQHQQQQVNNQIGMQLQMSQTQSINTVVSPGNANGSPMHPHQQYNVASPGTRGSLHSQVHPQQQQQQQPTDTSVSANDLNFDFLDNMQAGDTSNFNPQELLNSLDSGFNLDSIL